MTTVIALAAAAGLVIALSGIPALGPRGLARRIEPYLGGLDGRPAALGGGPTRRWGAAEWIAVRLGRGRSEDLAARLDAAGLPPNVLAFRVEQVRWGLGAVAAAAIAAGAGLASGAVDRPVTIPLLIGIAFATGFLGREWRLSRDLQRHRSALDDELPVAIDLVTLSIMAGESVPAAFARAASALGAGIGAELERVVGDVRAGTPVVDALEALDRRVGTPAASRFVGALITAIERGAPLADVLRSQSDDQRAARRRMLIEVAGRREVVMLVPVVFLILPVVVVFALYPGLVSLDLLVP